YYFGDINLAKDKFLRQETAKDDGWVPFDVLLTFNRLKALTQSAAEIVDAFRKSKSDLIEISEDETKIRRNVAKPLPEMTEDYKKNLNLRTVHLKGFPSDANYDDIYEFCSLYGQVESLEMRRTKDKKFKGCVFAVYKTIEEAEKAVAGDSKYKDENALLRENKVRYFERKNEYLANRNKRRKAKKGDKQENEDGDGVGDDVEKSNPVLTEKAVLKLKNIPPNVGFEVIKSKLNEFEKVMFVDVEKASTEGFARFGNENGAENVIKKIREKNNITDEEGLCTIDINGKEITLELVTGEEEIAYWKKFAMVRNERNQKKNHKRSKKNPKAYFQNKGKKRAAEESEEPANKQLKTENE
ncbi:lupus La protein-like protein, partial [Dinothrombium tinctorium]